MKKIFLIIMLTISSIYADTGYTLTVDSIYVSEDVGIANINIRVTPHNKETWNVGDQINLVYQTENASNGAIATANLDYKAIGITNLKIEPGVDGKAVINVPVEIIDDLVQMEDDENFILKIISASANNGKWVRFAEGGLLTIKDNDSVGLPSLSINDIIINESEGVARFRVSLSGIMITSDVTFKYGTVPGTATEGNDYIAKGEEGIIKVGETEFIIEIPIVNDLISEGASEHFSLYITEVSSNAKIIDARGVCTINDDDSGLTMSITDATIAESDVNSKAKIKIIFSQALTDSLTVNYHTEENTAKNDTDFIKIEAKQIIVPVGVLEYNLTIEIVGDNLAEGIEDFYVQIDSISGTNKPILADSVSKITIFDDDSAEQCSSLIGLMTINEYQNNPHYFTGKGEKVQGNYVEIKFIDFLAKQFVTDEWALTIYTNSGTQRLTWDQRDPNCVDPRYEVFQFDNEVMGAIGYVVLTDENGNEVDVLNIYNSDHYAQKCHEFDYDIDFESSAQNKDIFREPDGTGDWFDNGSGANSGGSRCVNRDGVTGLLFTEFDALDNDEVTPTIILNDSSVPIKTKVSNDDFSLKVISMDVMTGLLKNSTVNVKVFLADANGVKLQYNNPGVEVSFLNSNVVFKNGFKHIDSYKRVRLYFEYCTGSNETVASWEECHGGTNEDKTRQMRSHSRDMFSLRPDKLIISNNTNDNFYHLLKAGEDYNLSIQARDKINGRSTGYTVTNENYLLSLNISEKKYFKDGTEDTTGLLSGITQVDTANVGYMVNGLSSDTTTANALGKADEVISFNYSDVGNIKIEVYDKKWAEVDYDDTPADCNSSSHLFVCGEMETTFIPHHFEINDFKIKNNDGTSDNFTYVANDLDNMSAKIEASISAVNKGGAITENFKTGEKYYENPVSITPEVIIEDETVKDGYFYPTAEVSEVEEKLIEFGRETIDGGGVRTITFEEPEHKLNFNFKRDRNKEANPFIVTGNYISLKIESEYEDTSTGKEVDIVGQVAGDKVDPTKCLTDEHCKTLNASDDVLFYYGKAHSSKFLYDNEVGASAFTPIMIYTYCDLGVIACELYNIDLANSNTDKEKWWLSIDHKESNGDGKIVLETYEVTEGAGTPIVENGVVKIEASGLNEDASIKANATTRPMTTSIQFVTDDTLADYTSEWLIYNKEDSILDPKPFYKVRFVNPIAGWTGIGETGNVVEVDASRKRTRRMIW